MNTIIIVLWSSFVAGGVAEVLFFTVIDPAELYFLGRPVDMEPLAAYSLGFVFFWAFAAVSSVLSFFLLRVSGEADHAPYARR